jgi:hypothetical protein
LAKIAAGVFVDGYDFELKYLTVRPFTASQPGKCEVAVGYDVQCVWLEIWMCIVSQTHL